MKTENGKNKWCDTESVSNEWNKFGYECAYDKQEWNRDTGAPVSLGDTGEVYNTYFHLAYGVLLLKWRITGIFTAYYLGLSKINDFQNNFSTVLSSIYR